MSRKYFGTQSSLFFLLHSVLPSLVPYRFKGNRMLKTVAFIMIPFLLPLVCFQVYKSWTLATEKIKEGIKQ